MWTVKIAVVSLNTCSNMFKIYFQYSVGWSSVINTPPPIPDHFKTFAGSRSKPEPVPSMSELAQRSSEAGTLLRHGRLTY